LVEGIDAPPMDVSNSIGTFGLKLKLCSLEFSSNEKPLTFANGASIFTTPFFSSRKPLRKKKKRKH
jgi:hypothetical protein